MISTYQGQPVLTGANADGAYVLGGHLYTGLTQYGIYSPYPDGNGAYANTVNDNHDIGTFFPVGAEYTTRAKNDHTETDVVALPGNLGNNVEVEGLNNVGGGVGVTLLQDRSSTSVSNIITGIFTSHFTPSDVTHNSVPGGPNSGGTYDAKQVVQYAPLAGTTIRSVVGISNDDRIAGTLLAGTTNEAYVGSGGKITTLSAFGASEVNPLGYSYANDINALGQVVGNSTFGGVTVFNNAVDKDFTHGFIYQNGVMTDLNSYLDAATASKYTIDAGLSINDNGTILVEMQDGNGVFTNPDPRFGLLTINAIPGVPEPATWAMMIGGSALVGATPRRRRAISTKVSVA